ncbi:MAG TPA: hypothetical protein GX729_02150 [Firmicutes bacterium]|jgi:competence protein ComEA|nr:hypothetical protein [Bacillota bacterium]
MNRRADLIIYAICLLLLTGAAGLWWRGIFPSGDELVLTPDNNPPAWGDLGQGQGRIGQTGHPDSGTGGDSPGSGGSDENSREYDDNVIYVHIAGAVEAPGVYKLKQGQRLYEALELAVPLEDAALDYLNLAGLLYDQDKVYVPKKGELSGSAGTTTGGGPSGYGSARGGSGQTSTGVSFPININTATARELEALPGIGPAKAAAIVEFRNQRGPFARKEDLKKVSGIGDATYSKIESLITIR